MATSRRASANLRICRRANVDLAQDDNTAEGPFQNRKKCAFNEISDLVNEQLSVARGSTLNLPVE